MNWTLCLLFSTLVLLFIVIYLSAKLHRVKYQLAMIEEVLKDIRNGNLNRRMLTRKADMIRTICYQMNEIARQNQQQFIQLRQSEQAYKRLMTSLSHDIKTPLSSLIGYPRKNCNRRRKRRISWCCYDESTSFK